MYNKTPGNKQQYPRKCMMKPLKMYDKTPENLQ